MKWITKLLIKFGIKQKIIIFLQKKSKNIGKKKISCIFANKTDKLIV